MRSKTVQHQPPAHIILVTSEEVVQPEAEEFLRPAFEISAVREFEQVTVLAAQKYAHAVLLDLETASAKAERSLEWLQELRERWPDAVLVAMSRSQAQAMRRRALAYGADTFFAAPVNFAEVREYLVRTLEMRRREAEARVRSEILKKSSFHELIGSSEPMQRVYEAIRRVADSNTTVVIRGESGTGKELVARALVACSARRDRPLVSVNCAALPETLIEAELFGHEKGSFTGAHTARPGQIEMAHTGTLFLDEISSLDLGLQGKLLRALEEHTVQHLGGKTPHKVDFRLITATNDDMEEMVRAGRFREDLYYRIHVVPIFLPPLRDRPGDLPLLVDHFLQIYCGGNGAAPKRVEPDVLEILEEYSWPGNVRELENIVQRMALMSDGPVITAKDLPQQILYDSTSHHEALLIPEDGLNFYREMSRIELAYLQAALRRTEGQKKAAANLLQLKPQQMKYLCRKYKIA
jgi:DNA-binding NtrC family response regulator